MQGSHVIIIFCLRQIANIMERSTSRTFIGMVMSMRFTRRTPTRGPLKFSDAWAALDVGFDGHDSHVRSLGEVLEALEQLRRERR